MHKRFDRYAAVLLLGIYIARIYWLPRSRRALAVTMGVLVAVMTFFSLPRPQPLPPDLGKLQVKPDMPGKLGLQGKSNIQGKSGTPAGLSAQMTAANKPINADH